MKTLTRTNIVVILVLVVLFWTNTAFAKTIRFAQISDIHFSNHEKAENNRYAANTHTNLLFAIQSLNKQKIDFTVFLGDNINESEFENLTDFCEIIYNLKSPYYLVLGNHDAYKIKGIPKSEYMEFLSRHSKYQKSKNTSYYFYPDENSIAIVVDGATPFMPSKHGQYTEETLTWLDKVLTKNKNKIALIFQHFPIVYPSTYESHTTLNDDKYRDLLAKHKNVLLVSTGHYHKDKITIDENGICHISTPAFITPPYYYEIVEINYDKSFKTDRSKIKLDVHHIKI